MKIQKSWNDSYERKENFLFYPSDGVVQFVNRYIRKRIGISEFIDLVDYPVIGLDAGCGIGRHVKFGIEQGFSMFGFDLSSVSISIAHDWLARHLKICDIANLTIQSSNYLSYDNAAFNLLICDSVLDSMPFMTAQETIGEFYRISKPGTYFYSTYIFKSTLGTSWDWEIVIEDKHEKNTIQSYFDDTKIYRLLEPLFEIVTIRLFSYSSNDNEVNGRWQVVAKRRG